MRLVYQKVMIGTKWEPVHLRAIKRLKALDEGKLALCDVPLRKLFEARYY